MADGGNGTQRNVAVLDTGINAPARRPCRRVLQNVRLTDTQSVPGFSLIRLRSRISRTPILLSGHGTFVAGVIAASGVSSSERIPVLLRARDFWG